VHAWELQKCTSRILVSSIGNVKGTDHIRTPGVNRRIILKGKKKGKVVPVLN
jgi:hypothetical protein